MATEQQQNQEDEREAAAAAMLAEPLLTDHPVNLRRLAYNNTSQVAIVGSNLCPIESLDYELIENDFFKEDWRNRGRAHILRYVCLKWTFCFLIGVFAGAVGFFNNLAVENVAGFKFVQTSNLMLQDKYALAFAWFAISNFVLLMVASIVTVYIAPAAAGSGIPEVKAYLNGVDAPDIFSVKTLLVKVIANVAAVSSSLHVGKYQVLLPVVLVGESGDFVTVEEENFTGTEEEVLLEGADEPLL